MSDLINGLFEVLSGLFVLNNCRVLLKDKKVHGVSVSATVFFTMWGLWNLFYYPSLGQTLSFYAGFVVTGANVFWVALALRYRGEK